MCALVRRVCLRFGFGSARTRLRERRCISHCNLEREPGKDRRKRPLTVGWTSRLINKHDLKECAVNTQD